MIFCIITSVLSSSILVSCGNESPQRGQVNCLSEIRFEEQLQQKEWLQGS
jgi:hypothetical protein